jgi:hypothetical protein
MGFITPSYRRLAFFAGFFFGFCFRVDGSPAGGGGVLSNALAYKQAATSSQNCGRSMHVRVIAAFRFSVYTNTAEGAWGPKPHAN